jgi:hypothetical protein
MRALVKAQTDLGVAGPAAAAALADWPALAAAVPTAAACLQQEPRFAALHGTFGAQLTPQGALGTGALSAVEVCNVTVLRGGAAAAAPPFASLPPLYA